MKDGARSSAAQHGSRGGSLAGKLGRSRYEVHARSTKSVLPFRHSDHGQEHYCFYNSEVASLEYSALWYSEVAFVVCGLSSIPKVLFVEYQKCCLWYMALRWSLWYTEVAFVVCGLSGIPKWPSWYVASLVYRGAVCGIPGCPVW